MEDDELEFGEIDGDDGLSEIVEIDDVPSNITYVASDKKGRHIETCQLEMGGTVEDLLASALDLVSFLKKYKSGHTFKATGD
jgi:hypothetical protein